MYMSTIFSEDEKFNVEFDIQDNKAVCLYDK